MIPLREGLIGKRNIKNAGGGGSKIEQYDIVNHMFSGSLYFVLTDPKLVKCLPLSKSDMDLCLEKGILLYYWGLNDKDFSWIPLAHYDNNLNYNGWMGTNSQWNIKEIYRRNTTGEVKVNNLKDIKEVARANSLKLLVGHFTKIYDRKK